MKLYINDITTNTVQFFNNLNELISYSEGVIKRKTGQARKAYMFGLYELGHGEDDKEGRNFIKAISNICEVGVIKDNARVRCDVSAIDLYSKSEYGN